MTTKIVIVLAAARPAPTAANTAALLALSIGARHPEIIGEDIPDADGNIHRGISGVPVPVLTTPQRELAALAASAQDLGLDVVDFTSTAARARTYDGYTAAMAATPTTDLDYRGLAIIGDKKVVTSLTGALPLLR